MLTTADSKFELSRHHPTMALQLLRTLTGFDAPTYAVFVGTTPAITNTMLLVSEAHRATRRHPITGALLGTFGEGVLQNPMGISLLSRGHVLFGQQGVRGLQILNMVDNGKTLVQSCCNFDDANEDHRIDSALGVAASDEQLAFVADVTGYAVSAHNIGPLSERVWSAGQYNISSELKRATGCTDRPAKAGTPFNGPSCFNPHGLGYSPRNGGRLFVADADLGALVVLNARTGAFVKAIRDSRLFSTPRGVAVTKSNRLLVVERQRIVLLSLNGRRIISEMNHVAGAVNMLGVSVDEDDKKAYVADPGANAVFVFGLPDADVEMDDGRPRVELRSKRGR